MPKIAAISIYVNDMDQAIDFYPKHLGFTVANRPVPFIAELVHEGAALVLCQAERPVNQSYPDGAGTVVGIATANVADKATALRKAKVQVLHDTPQDFPGGQYVA